jgi:hypothetical protein
MSSEEEWTMPLVPFAERFYGLSRSGAYSAARAGQIPVKRIGNRWLGLVQVAKQQLTAEQATNSQE